ARPEGALPDVRAVARDAAVDERHQLSRVAKQPRPEVARYPSPRLWWRRQSELERDPVVIDRSLLAFSRLPGHEGVTRRGRRGALDRDEGPLANAAKKTHWPSGKTATRSEPASRRHRRQPASAEDPA